MSNSDKRLTHVIECKHCYKMAQMEICASYEQTSTIEDEGEYGVLSQYQEVYVYDVLVCPSCVKVMLGRYHLNSDAELSDEFYTPEREILYPLSDSTPKGLPDVIEKAYYAALKVRGIDPNAYAVLIGRVLEMVCVDRKATGKYLHNKIADLAAKKEIPDKLVDVANCLKHLRNIGAHATLGELTIYEIHILDDLCKAILEYVYSAPYLVTQAESRIEKLKKENQNN